MGWFSNKHKKPIPKFPKRIGVVTSPTGAAIQDILNILTRRFSGFNLLLNPVRVQGDGAAQEIAQAIQQFNEHNLVDVIIVGRGGGSIEDLWAFNEEIVAEAIFKSQIPVIAAAGHETDHCIAEYVADVRAPTPSAAAEIVIAEKAQQQNFLIQTQNRLTQTIQHLLRQNKNRLDGILRHPIFTSTYALPGPWMQKLDDLKQSLDLSIKQSFEQKKLQLDARQKILFSLNPITKISHSKQKLFSLSKHLENTINRNLSLKKERLKNVVSALKSINPKNLLTKGYSILFSEKDHSVISSVVDLEKDQKLRILLSDGEILTTINEVYQNGREK